MPHCRRPHCHQHVLGRRTSSTPLCTRSAVFGNWVCEMSANEAYVFGARTFVCAVAGEKGSGSMGAMLVLLLCTSARRALSMSHRRQGSVVGTLAWNTTRHFEAWYVENYNRLPPGRMCCNLCCFCPVARLRNGIATLY